MQGSLDDYLKLHAGPRTTTTFAQKETREYDFTAVDQLENDRTGYRSIQANINESSRFDEDSFEASKKPNTAQTIKAEKAFPRKELQAFCPAPQSQ